MRVKTWKVLDWGDVPNGSPTVPVACRCGVEAELPILGRVLAIIGDGTDIEGVIFDQGPYALPSVIQCRRCRRIFTQETSEPSDVR